MFVELTDSGIHSEQDIADFTIKDGDTNRLPLNKLQWQLFYVKDYTENESCIILKINHTLSDGNGIMLLGCELSE